MNTALSQKVFFAYFMLLNHVSGLTLSITLIKHKQEVFSPKGSFQVHALGIVCTTQRCSLVFNSQYCGRKTTPNQPQASRQKGRVGNLFRMYQATWHAGLLPAGTFILFQQVSFKKPRKKVAATASYLKYSSRSEHLV